MKYMIIHYASQADIDAMAGKETAAGPAWTPEEVRAMGEFMGGWTDELVGPASSSTPPGWPRVPSLLPGMALVVGQVGQNDPGGLAALLAGDRRAVPGRGHQPGDALDRCPAGDHRPGAEAPQRRLVGVRSCRTRTG